MVDARPYLHVLGAQIRAQTQYRASFAMDLIGSTALTALDVATVFVMFRVAGRLGGFGAREVLLMLSLSTFSFPIADAAFGAAEQLRVYVRTGKFDTLLVRPLSPLVQLLAMDFAPRRVGRVVQGLAVYVVALVIGHVHWTAARVALAVAAPVAGAVFFSSLFLAGATVTFWWVESGEVANGFTYGGKEFTSYPVTVYGELFRKLFAYGLGFGFISYLPTLALLDLPDPLHTPEFLRWCGPLVALLAALLAAAFWRTGIRHYRSTGS